jgi:signal transduction histidine kinase
VKLSLWDPRRVLVSVIDEGPPIPADQRDRIFRRFYRMDNRDSRSVYGLGLGLYITQKLVTALGGQIWVEESESQGNRFCFTLPRWQERA